MKRFWQHILVNHLNHKFSLNKRKINKLPFNYDHCNKYLSLRLKEYSKIINVIIWLNYINSRQTTMTKEVGLIIYRL